ncbi:MAG: S8 family serine peptidase, partial [Thermoplasmata archaeon]|nr:S8 family serine peptidase [Thermoplasmata archaeon]
MEHENLKLVSRVLVIAVALTMVLPVSSVFLGQSDTVVIPEMASVSTTINFGTAGLGFDNSVGEPAIPANMKATNNDKYIVQFNGPIDSAWTQELRGMGLRVHQYVEDYAYVVTMDSSMRSTVEALPNVGWVGVYQPAYKVDYILDDKVGMVDLTVYSFEDTPALANKLKNFGTVVEIQKELNKVLVTVDADNIPAIAQLNDVKEVYFRAEYQTLNNRAGEVEGNHYLWDTTLSGLPIIITGLGIRVGIADTGWDNGDTTNGHWDFTRGPLGSRMAGADAEGSGDEHGTHCAGIVAGNGYCMEEFLGLDNMNQVYFESAASNPAGMGDLQGFAGVAPEATVEARGPLGTADWAGMTANGCVVISNSWGPGGTPAANYDNDALDADQEMEKNDNILVIFATGNSGPS